MKAFADKIRDARTELGLSQPQLAEKCGLSVRVILDYEKGKKRPRPTTMMKLAKALQVSTKFLSDDECDNPMEDIEKDGYIEEARIRYGSNGAKEVDALLAANKAALSHILCKVRRSGVKQSENSIFERSDNDLLITL